LQDEASPCALIDCERVGFVATILLIFCLIGMLSPPSSSLLVQS
jgi:hypothetical protein